MRTITVFIIWLVVFIPACATGSGPVSDEDTTDALKQALTQGADVAVDKLGVADGFLNNPKVKIPLPGALQKVEGIMRTLGMSKYADGLIVTMNHAAETAAAEAKPLLMDAVQKMSVEDAEHILASGDDAATQYFRTDDFRRIVSKIFADRKKCNGSGRIDKKYNEFAGKGAKLGLIGEKDANIENYVTQKTLDGLYLMMAEEERAIRSDPMGQGSRLTPASVWAAEIIQSCRRLPKIILKRSSAFQSAKFFRRPSFQDVTIFFSSGSSLTSQPSRSPISLSLASVNARTAPAALGACAACSIWKLR